MQVLYEDNHLIIVSKTCTEIVQADKTGDKPLSEIVQDYLKEKYNKPGNVFIGVTHRLDRPTSGVVVFAKTSKALSRMNDIFRDHNLTKKYWAIVKNCPPDTEGTLVDYLVRVEKLNKSFAYPERRPNAKKSILHYKVIAKSDNYCLLEINLETGRHHQIRCQLSNIGCPIRGDLKYGYPRSNPDGGISLHARSIEFVHPVSHKTIHMVAPVPENDPLWQAFSKILAESGYADESFVTDAPEDPEKNVNTQSVD